MTTMQDLFAQDADATSVRMTGKAIAQWESIWMRRRAAALKDHKLSGRHYYTADQREDAIRFYDLTIEDFDPVVAKAGEKASLPHDYKDFDRVTIAPDRASDMVESHRANAERQGQSCPPLAAIVLYRIHQSALNRVAAEAYERDEA